MDRRVLDHEGNWTAPGKIDIDEGLGWTRIVPPSGLGWNPPIIINRLHNGQISTGFNVSDYEYKGGKKTYYVNVNASAVDGLEAGNDSNDGLSPLTPFKSLHKAIAAADVDIIIIAGGTYYRGNSFFGAAINRSVTIKAAGSTRVILGMKDFLNWAKTAGQTNVYQTTRSLVGRVFDTTMTVDGDYRELTNRASIAEVDANPGSWFQSGSTLYVSAHDSRAVTNTIWAFIAADNLKHVGGKTIYLEGIDLLGGTSCAYVANTSGVSVPKLYAKNCSFKYSVSDAGGVTVLGASEVFMQNCVAARNANDGFNYHALNGINPNVIEVDCIGRHNGISGDTDNGSSIHDGGKIIRVNGRYHDNIGPNVPDVNAGTKSWNIGCIAFNSNATLTYQDADFLTNDGSEMWLDSCVGVGSIHSLFADTGSTIHKRNCKMVTETVYGKVDDY